MFVFWPFLALNIASHPEHKSFVFLNMLVWLMKISFLQKLKSTDYPFWVQNTSQKFISDMFYDRRHVYCKCFHLLFLIRCFFIKSKIENVKYSFWLQKEVKSHIRFVFSIHNPPILGGFICYFWFIAILLRQNLKNVKYRFWLQKGIKNWKWSIFLMGNFQNVRSFLL